MSPGSPTIWEVLHGLTNPQEAGKWLSLWNQILDTSKEDRARFLEDQDAGRLYRHHLRRLDLPQPDTLLGIDIVEEVIRLAGIPPSDPTEPQN